MNQLLYLKHDCVADEHTANALYNAVAEAVNKYTTPSVWLPSKNLHLNKCQRCGYIWWRAP